MSLHYLGKHEPGNCVFSVRHRHVSSPGECGWLRAGGKARGRHFEHLQLTGSVQSHPNSPGEDTCLWHTIQYHIRQHSRSQGPVAELVRVPRKAKGDKEVSEGDRRQDDEIAHHFEILRKLVHALN